MPPPRRARKRAETGGRLERIDSLAALCCALGSAMLCSAVRVLHVHRRVALLVVREHARERSRLGAYCTTPCSKRDLAAARLAPRLGSQDAHCRNGGSLAARQTGTGIGSKCSLAHCTAMRNGISAVPPVRKPIGRAAQRRRPPLCRCNSRFHHARSTAAAHRKDEAGKNETSSAAAAAVAAVARNGTALHFSQ